MTYVFRRRHALRDYLNYIARRNCGAYTTTVHPESEAAISPAGLLLPQSPAWSGLRAPGDDDDDYR